ncbi:MAG: hypothetical protein LBD52_03975 [Prevotellaceae bacterium]|jgi:hypothetical protein|nr:hypothetical protein [Prevotellaceae bacterium]
MLDLHKLEQSIDEALASETTESLTEWLLNQRDRNLSAFLGDGYFEALAPTSIIFKQNTNSVLTTVETCDIPNDYQLAA